MVYSIQSTTGAISEMVGVHALPCTALFLAASFPHCSYQNTNPNSIPVILLLTGSRGWMLPLNLGESWFSFDFHCLGKPWKSRCTRNYWKTRQTRRPRKPSEYWLQILSCTTKEKVWNLICLNCVIHQGPAGIKGEKGEKASNVLNILYIT